MAVLRIDSSEIVAKLQESGHIKLPEGTLPEAARRYKYVLFHLDKVAIIRVDIVTGIPKNVGMIPATEVMKVIINSKPGDYLKVHKFVTTQRMIDYAVVKTSVSRLPLR